MPGEDVTIRVTTYNIRAAIGTGPFPDRWWGRIDADRLRAIGAFVASLDADVVALQEVAVVSHAGVLLDNADELAQQLGMQVRYGAVRNFPTIEADGTVSGAGLFGNALLSRLPVRSARTVALPAAPLDAFVEPPGADHPAAGLRYADAPATIREPRCLVMVDLELPDGRAMRTGSAHFSNVGSGERALQAGATARAFGEAPLALLLGDLNAAIESPELAALEEWTDAFAATGVPAGDPVRVSTDDGWRIDQVLVRGGQVRSCRVATEAGGLSDHFPVVAEIAIRHSS